MGALILCYNKTNGGAFGKRMVQTLEQYVAEATNAYKPAKTAIQSQIDALAGQLDTTNQQINKNYAQQQAGLNRQRNMAAETASMQAAGSGGSFGGAANLANRRYYDQSFVPAVTQMRTNQSNELAQARQANEDRRTNYGSQLANIDAQANQYALAQYYKDIADQQARDFQAQQAELQRQFQAEQAEKDRQAQARAAAQASAAQDAYYKYMMEAMRGNGGTNNVNKNQVSFLDWIDKYSGWDNNTKNYWTTNINNIYNNPSDMMKNALNRTLQISAQYKQYLNWRNS